MANLHEFSSDLYRLPTFARSGADTLGPLILGGELTSLPSRRPQPCPPEMSRALSRAPRKRSKTLKRLKTLVASYEDAVRSPPSNCNFSQEFNLISAVIYPPSTSRIVVGCAREIIRFRRRSSDRFAMMEETRRATSDGFARDRSRIGRISRADLRSAEASERARR